MQSFSHLFKKYHPTLREIELGDGLPVLANVISTLKSRILTRR